MSDNEQQAMSSHSENTKRIAKNTMMLYMRMIITVLISLYATRVVLEALGENDYGLYNLVGAITGMIGILTTLLSQGSSRFITIALGKGNLQELKTTFSASITIHAILGAFVFLIGIIIGSVIVSKLNISPDRIDAAQFVFKLSLVAAVIGIIQAPFHSTIIAHEKMAFFAYVSIWDAIAKLLIVYLLTAVNADKLKTYAALYLCVNIITALIYYGYCNKKFEECRRIRYKIDIKLYKDFFKYIGWNSISVVAFTLNGQGITVLLNMFGTAVVAARGIANTVSNFVFSFVMNFQTAVRPQIFKLYSVNDISSMNKLIKRTSRLSSYLIGIIGIPLFIEMETVLSIWLKEVPEYTCTFVRLALIQGLIQAIDLPIGAGIHAVGKMRLPNITSSLIYMAILPISYFAVIMGALPNITYIIVVCVYPLALIMDLYILHRYTGFPLKEFVGRNILLPTLFIITTGYLVYIITNNNNAPSIIKILYTVLTSTAIFVPMAYWGGLIKEERAYLQNVIKQKLSRILHK